MEKCTAIETVYDWLLKNTDQSAADISLLKERVASNSDRLPLMVRNDGHVISSPNNDKDVTDNTEYVMDTIGESIIRKLIVRYMNTTNNSADVIRFCTSDLFGDETSYVDQMLQYFISNNLYDFRMNLMYFKTGNRIIHVRYPFVASPDCTDVTHQLRQFVGFGMVLQSIGMDAETAWVKAYEMATGTVHLQKSNIQVLLEKVKNNYPTATIEFDKVSINNQPTNLAIRVTPHPFLLDVNKLRYLYNKHGNLDKDMMEAIKVRDNRPTKEGVAAREWTKIKDYIQPKLINYVWNEDRLKNMPHRRFLDLAIVYCVDTIAIEDTFDVDNEYMKMWGVDENELYQVAMNNVNWQGYDMRPLQDAIGEEAATRLLAGYTNLDVLHCMYLEDGYYYYGATAMVHVDTMKQMATNLHSNFYIVACSIYELLIIPCREDQPDIDTMRIRDTVVDKSLETICTTERLSSSLYYYDMGTGKISIVAAKP